MINDKLNLQEQSDILNNLKNINELALQTIKIVEQEHVISLISINLMYFYITNIRNTSESHNLRNKWTGIIEKYKLGEPKLE